MSRAGTLALGAAFPALLLAATSTRPAAAAFEAPAADPARLILCGPAWPLAGRPAADAGTVFAQAPPLGLSASTLRWQAAPGLRSDAVAGGVRVRGIFLAARTRRLGVGTYGETELSLEAARPAAGAGWGWSVAAGLVRWGVAGSEASGSRIVAALGFAPAAALRAAVRLVDFGGAAGVSASGSLELGMTCDATPAWRLGAVYLTGRSGGAGEIRAGVECRPARGLSLRLGLMPAGGAAAIGAGLTRGPLDVEVARADHPRLGAMTCLGVGIIGHAGEAAP